MSAFHDFKAIFLAIVIESFPFLLIGAFVAAIIETFVSEKTISKFLSKNPFIQTISACFMGVFFPLCECAIIPVARSLIAKGIPVRIALLFMFVAPIINPIALTATYFAFSQSITIVLYRAILGLFVALIVSFIFSRTKKEKILLKNTKHKCSCGDDHIHIHDMDKIQYIPVINKNIGVINNHIKHTHRNLKTSSKLKKILDIIRLTRFEFLNVGKYLIIGAIISALIQVFMPVDLAISLKKSTSLSIFSLQSLGYLLSLCSHSDAFVASGFMNQFPFHAVLAFLIISPLIDIKNTFVLTGLFKKKFSFKLVISVFIITFISGYLIKVLRI